MRALDATSGLEGPVALQWLDPPRRADHLLLGESDHCAYLAEYAAGRIRDGSLNRLIRHFKCEPSVARVDPLLARHKRQALIRLARRLRLAVPREYAERCTWVPVPPSKQDDDPDFDDRLPRTLALAFEGYDLDLRCLLRQTRSTARDHATATRLSEEALYRLLQVDIAALKQRSLREHIVLFDDVLTSGKHYKCCERRLREYRPQASIIGVFLMRRAPARSQRSLGRAW